LAHQLITAPTKTYVVGGTAAVVLSTRRSQSLIGSTIILIEAGPAVFDELGINVLKKKGSTLGTKYDWNFTTIPQPALNLMTCDWSSEHKYDGRGQVGKPGWNFNTFEDVMDRAEELHQHNYRIV
jgi:hypothetical protein